MCTGKKEPTDSSCQRLYSTTSGNASKTEIKQQFSTVYTARLVPDKPAACQHDTVQQEILKVERNNKSNTQYSTHFDDDGTQEEQSFWKLMPMSLE
jgi:hypothetical protein